MGLRDVTQLETLGHLELLGFTFGSTEPTRTCITKLTPMVRFSYRSYYKQQGNKHYEKYLGSCWYEHHQLP